MAGYSQDVLEDLRQGNDIIDVISQYVQLKAGGTNHVGLCPFHNEKTPSFSVSPQKQLFHCFGCGESGNVFSFVMKIENYGFLDAVKFLADRINYNLPPLGSATPANIAEKNMIYDAYRLAARYYYDTLQSPQGRAAAAYLDRRRISHGMRRRFGLGVSPPVGLYEMLAQKGYAMDFLVKAGLVMQDARDESRFYDRFRNRLMFPIFDVSGKVIGFGGRILGDGQPKYLNSPETPIFDKSRTLYGLNFARKAKADAMILVEGYMDVIALHQAGFANTVAALGTAFTANAARILSRYCKQALVLFDGDEAGWKAVLRTIWHLYSVGLMVKVVVLPDAKDPDEYLTKFGAQMLAQRFSAATDFVVHHIQAARKKYDIDIPGERIAFLQEVSEVTKRLNTAIEREVYERLVSKEYGISQDAIREYKAKDDDGPIILPAKRLLPKQTGETTAFADAASHILYSMAQNAELCGKITAHLRAEEMINPLYIKIFAAIEAARNRGAEIGPADIITAMESPQEQSAAAAMFSRVMEYIGMDAQYAALSQQILLVKREYLQKIMDEMDKSIEFERFARVSSEYRQLEGQKISL
jgi:DNA primase